LCHHHLQQQSASSIEGDTVDPTHRPPTPQRHLRVSRSSRLLPSFLMNFPTADCVPCLGLDFFGTKSGKMDAREGGKHSEILTGSGVAPSGQRRRATVLLCVFPNLLDSDFQTGVILLFVSIQI
jgi:hypothetical protein